MTLCDIQVNANVLERYCKGCISDTLCFNKTLKALFSKPKDLKGLVSCSGNFLLVMCGLMHGIHQND